MWEESDNDGGQAYVACKDVAKGNQFLKNILRQIFYFVTFFGEPLYKMFSLLDNFSYFTVCGLTAFRLSLYVSYILLWKCYPYREKYAAMFTTV